MIALCEVNARNRHKVTEMTAIVVADDTMLERSEVMP